MQELRFVFLGLSGVLGQVHETAAADLAQSVPQERQDPAHLQQQQLPAVETGCCSKTGGRQ